MTGIIDSDMRYCEQLVLTRAGLLTVTHRFFPRNTQQKLLSLHALFTAIRSIPFKVSDPDVGGRKIAWWFDELKPGARSLSQHPVIKACLARGVFQYFKPPEIYAYLTEWVRFATGDPIPDLEEFRELMLRLGAIEACVEFNILTEECKKSDLSHTGAALTILNFLEHFDFRVCGESWWLPLDLQARSGVTFDSLKLQQHQSGVNAAIVALCNLGLEFCDTARSELKAIRETNITDSGTRHLCICLGLSERRLKVLRKNPNRHKRLGLSPSEVFFAWRLAVMQ